MFLELLEDIIYLNFKNTKNKGEIDKFSIMAGDQCFLPMFNTIYNK